MKDIAYYNGQIGEIMEIKAPITDRGFYFGDGVYEAVYCRNKIPFALSDHLDRLENSLSLLRIPMPMPRAELDHLICSLIEKLNTDALLFCYFQVTRGNDYRHHSFPENATPSLMIMIRQTELDNITTPIKLISMLDTRFLHCNIKTLNLLPNVLAVQKAKEAGGEESVFYRDGFVTEGAHSNIAMFKDGIFITPPLSERILAGITRKHCLALCQALSIPTKEQDFTLSELLQADEIMILSSGCWAAPVSYIDDKPVGGKASELLLRLQTAYTNKFETETTK